MDPDLLDYADYPKMRKLIFDSTQQALQQAFPISNDRYTLTLADVNYKGPEHYTKADEKKARLRGKSLTRRLTGAWIVTDNATGQVVSRSRPRTVVNVPYMTANGTFIRNGVEYTVSKQFRLRPGVYTRITDDGHPESQFNAQPRTGSSFRIFMDPASSVFYMKHKGNKVPLYPVLQAMGVNDDALKQRWSDSILQANRVMAHKPHATSWINKMSSPDPNAFPVKEEEPKEAAEQIPVVAQSPEEVKRQRLLSHFDKVRLDPMITAMTLGKPHDRASTDAILDSTDKILRVARREADIDDRDSLLFQTIHDASDFLAEKIRNDQNGHARKMLWKVTGKNGDTNTIPASFMDKHIVHLFDNTGLGQNIEEINPMDPFDQNQRVVRMGEGALPSIDMVPKDARNVQPSYLGFVDAVRSPESLKVGVDMRLARNVRKGPGNLLYSRFVDISGKPLWVDQQKAAQSVIGFASSRNDKRQFVPAMIRGQVGYANRNEVDFYVANGDDEFSYGANLVPLKSSDKAMRLSMGSKFSVAALPLVNREAPLVRTEDPDYGSTEEYLGKFLGALRADKPGTVLGVYQDHIKVKNDDGTVAQYDMYVNHPFASKTFIRNMPLVKAGTKIKPGQMLASSNYTNDDGIASLGRNLKVAYVTYHGKNFEDAVVVSESAARNLTSEHMYQESLEKDEGLHIGKDKFYKLYPGRFSRDQMKTIDDSGMAKPGTQLKYGDPIMLAVREREPAQATMGRRMRSDSSIVWKHQFPATVISVVTDVVEGRKSHNIYVRANVPLEVGDKLTQRHGGKGVVAEIVADDQMMKDKDGVPFDILLAPEGLLTRTNPAQNVETQLGKVAAKTGVPYTVPGFSDEDAIEFMHNELKRNRLQSEEEIYDPVLNKKIPEVFTGMQYFYKLQQTAEGKSKGRSTGRYTSEEQPARGSGSGSKHIGDMELQALLSHGACFLAGTDILTKNGRTKIDKIVGFREPVEVLCKDVEGKMVYRPVVDWLVRSVSREDFVAVHTTARAGGNQGQRKALRCTRGHEFYTDRGKVQAAMLCPGDVVYTPGTILTEEQLILIRGSLMGDGYAYCKRHAWRFQEVHSVSQSEYLLWKSELLRNITLTIPASNKRGKSAKNFKGSRDQIRFTTRAHYQIGEVAKSFYVEKSKEPPEGIVKQLGWAGLAVWFGDDGSLTASKGIPRAFRLHTCAFTEKAVQRLVGELIEFTGLPDWGYHMQNGKYPVIQLQKGGRQGNSLQRFAEGLKRYLPECIRYKLGSLIDPEERVGEYWDTVEVPTGVYAEPCEVLTVETLQLAPHEKSVVYNITVKDLHNYVANGVVVGNSEVIKDLKIIKGQKNDDFWRQLKMGHTPAMPGTPLVYDKFKDLIRAAGVDLREEASDHDNIFAMSKKRVHELTGNRRIQSTATYKADDMTPMPGGLFDPQATGADQKGDKWAYIQLPEPMLNPIMYEPVRTLLGLKRKELDAILQGETQVSGKYGGEALAGLLKSVDLESVKRLAVNDIKFGAKGGRDAAIKRYQYAAALEKQKLRPEDFLWDRVPVLPPRFRPIFRLGKQTVVSDPNYMYKALMDASQDFEEAQKEKLPLEQQQEARKVLNKTLQAVIGVGDPVQGELQNKKVGGILQQLFGKGSPKVSFVQRRVIGTNIDVTGLSVIVPNPSLKLNEVGLPEARAWEIYQPFIVRHLVRQGVPAIVAAKAVHDKDKAAYAALQSVIQERPVIINRAPTLHKYSMLAAWPRLTKGHTLQIPPAVTGPFGADFDGDTMSYSVPVSSAAVEEAKAKMLPERLLLSERFDQAQFVPGNEYVKGLYLATKSPKQKPVQHFASKADAFKAYRDGKIAVDDPIVIG